jgi:hypothetical protein
MRICGFLLLALLGVANLTIKSRLPPKPRQFKVSVLFEPFKELSFVLVGLSAFLVFFGIFIPIK